MEEFVFYSFIKYTCAKIKFMSYKQYFERAVKTLDRIVDVNQADTSFNPDTKKLLALFKAYLSKYDENPDKIIGAVCKAFPDKIVSGKTATNVIEKNDVVFTYKNKSGDVELKLRDITCHDEFDRKYIMSLKDEFNDILIDLMEEVADSSSTFKKQAQKIKDARIGDSSMIQRMFTKISSNESTKSIATMLNKNAQHFSAIDENGKPNLNGILSILQNNPEIINSASKLMSENNLIEEFMENMPSNISK